MISSESSKDIENIFEGKTDEEIYSNDLFINAMDIFMYLNINNDQYLDIKRLTKIRDSI